MGFRLCGGMWVTLHGNTGGSSSLYEFDVVVRLSSHIFFNFFSFQELKIKYENKDFDIRNSKGNGLETALPLPRIPSNG